MHFKRCKSLYYILCYATGYYVNKKLVLLQITN